MNNLNNYTLQNLIDNIIKLHNLVFTHKIQLKSDKDIKVFKMSPITIIRQRQIMNNIDPSVGVSIWFHTNLGLLVSYEFRFAGTYHTAHNDSLISNKLSLLVHSTQLIMTSLLSNKLSIYGDIVSM